MTNDSSNKSFSPINTILSKGRKDRHALLDVIKKNAPLTPYRLSKLTNIAYNTIAQICREFEFARLIEFKVVLGDNNKCHKLILIPDGGEVGNES